MADVSLFCKGGTLKVLKAEVKQIFVVIPIVRSGNSNGNKGESLSFGGTDKTASAFFGKSCFHSNSALIHREHLVVIV